MSIFTDAFDAIADALGDDVMATLRHDTGSFDVTLGSGVEGMRLTDETGALISKAAIARYKLSDDPAIPLKEKDLVTIKAGNAPIQSMRVVGRMDIAGLVRLTLIAEFE